MYLKRKHIALLCVLISHSAFAVGCSSSTEEVKYDFPLEKDVVEQVLSDQQLTWNIEDEQSFVEGQSVFSLKDDDGVICSLNSYSGENGKFIKLQFHFPQDYTAEQIQRFNEEQWSNLFDLTSTFYGNSKDSKKAYKELLDYLKDRNSIEYKYGYFTKRIGDIHYRAKFGPFTNDSNYYQMATLEVLNSETYEKGAYGNVAGWIQSAKRQGIEVFEDISVSDIAEINTEDEVLGLIVQGRLEDVQKLKTVPETLQKALTYKPNKNDYFTAKLVDDTGSIDVLLLVTSLNSKELQEDRNHHINYYAKEKLSVISISPLVE